MKKRPARPALSDLQSARPLPRTSQNRRRLFHELLERRDLLAAGTNYLVLDFTPDVIEDEIQPASFLSTFTSAGLRQELDASTYRYLDFNNNGTTDISDARIAATRISQDVRRRLRSLLDDPTVDLRVKFSGNDLDWPADQNDGQSILETGADNDDENVFVIYVGGHMMTPEVPLKYRNWWGIAEQGFVGENHEFYGYALSERIAFAVADGAFETKEIVGNSSGTDQMLVRTVLEENPESPGTYDRVRIVSENATFDGVTAGDDITIKFTNVLEGEGSNGQDIKWEHEEQYTIGTVINSTTLVLEEPEDSDHVQGHWTPATGLATQVTGDRLIHYRTLQRDFIRKVSEVIVHEFGHLLGLGHVSTTVQGMGGPEFRDNPTPDTNVMNYNAPVATSRFVNAPSRYDTELAERPSLPFTDPNSIYPSGVNHFQEVYQSLLYDSVENEFVQESYTNIYRDTTLENMVYQASKGFVGSDSHSDDFFTSIPFRDSPPAPTLGTLGSSTPNDVIDTLSQQWSEFRGNGLESLVDQFDWPDNSLPFLTSSIGSLTELDASINGSLTSIDATGISTMLEIQNRIESYGYTVDHIISDTAFANLDPNQPADYLRFSIQVPIQSGVAEARYDGSATTAVSDLSDLPMDGTLRVETDAVLNLTVGVDTGGFYLLPGEVLRLRLDAAGAIQAADQAVSVSGDASVSIAPTLDLQSPSPDGRIRAAHLTDGSATNSGITLAGSAAIGLDFAVTLPGSHTTTLNGHWIWDIEGTSSNFVADDSGYDTEGLALSLSELASEAFTSSGGFLPDMIDDLNPVPIVGDVLSAEYASIASPHFEFENTTGDIASYFEARGFSLDSIVNPQALASSVINGTPIAGDLIRISYSQNPPATSIAYQVDRTGSLPGVNVLLAGTASGNNTTDASFQFGYDGDHGAFVVEGSNFSNNFQLGGPLSGTATAAGLASITASAAGVFNVNARFEINDGDATINEKLYLDGPSGQQLPDAIARADSYSVSGEASLNQLKLTGKINLLPADYPAITICGDAHWSDLSSPDATLNLDSESVLESLFQIGDHSLKNIRQNLGNLADKVISEIPYIGKQLSAILPAELDEGLTFAPTGITPFEQRLNAIGISVVSSIDGNDLLKGDFTSSGDLIVLNFAESIPHDLPSTSFSAEEKNFGIGSFEVGGSFGGTANVLYDITFGYNVDEGFFIGHESDANGSRVELSLTADANLPSGQNFLVIRSPAGPNWFTANAVGSLDLEGFNTSYPLVGPQQRTYQSLLLLDNDVTYDPGTVTADLQLSVDYANLPVIGPFLELIPAFQASPFTWSTVISHDPDREEQERWQVVLDAETPIGDNGFDAARTLLEHHEGDILSSLVDLVLAEMVREENRDAHPIPSPIREVLSEGIEFLGMIDENLPEEERHRNLLQSITGSDIADKNQFPPHMLDALQILLAPDEHIENERATLTRNLIDAHTESSSDEGVSVHYDFTEASNLLKLLKGEHADLFRVSFSDPQALSLGTEYQVVPDQTVLSLWGAVNVDLSATISPSITASYHVDVGVGTNGLFIDPSSEHPLFSFTGSLPVNLNADLKLSALNHYDLLTLAEGKLAFGVDLTGGVQLTERVYPLNEGVDLGELLDDQIELNATLDLWGKAGLKNETVGLDLEIVEYEGGEPDFTFPLYKGSASVGNFKSFKEDFLNKTQNLRDCASILSRAGSILSVPGHLTWCVGDLTFGDLTRENIENEIIRQRDQVHGQYKDFKENPKEYVFNGLEQQGKNLQQLGDGVEKIGKTIMTGIGRMFENGIDFLANPRLMANVGGAIISARDAVNDFLADGGRAGAQMLEDIGTFGTTLGSWVPDTGVEVVDDPGEAFNKLTNGIGFGLTGGGEPVESGWNVVNQLPYRWTYSWTLEPLEFGKRLVIDWNESEASYWIRDPNGNTQDPAVNFVIGATRGENANDPPQLFVDAPDFDRNETLATHPDYPDNPFRAPVTHQNMAVFPLADIREIHILGTDYDDRIVVLPAGEQGEVKLESVSASLVAAGFGGNDFIVGGPVEDRLYGFSGRDTIIGGSGADEIWGGNGIDLLQGGDGPDTIRGGAHPDHLQGQGGSDHLYGYSDLSDGTGVEDPNDGNDLIDGGDGDDVLWGGVSGPAYGAILTQNDDGTYDVGPAVEMLIGGPGEDTLYGGSGPDELFGDSGNDTLDGGSGNDRLVGGRDSDHLLGGDDDDSIFGDFANDANNELYDDLFGGDYVDGGFGNDTIFGGPGEDRLNGGGGADHVEGQQGNDYLGGGVLGINELGEVVNHFIYLDANDVLKGGDGNDVIWGGASGPGLEMVVGTTGGMDLLLGEDGHDTIRGGLGPDYINGGYGDDFLVGENGDDILISESGAAWLEGGEGHDQLIGSEDVDRGLGSYLIGGDTTSSFDDDTLIGSYGPDTLIGGNGDDVLLGAFGNDSLIGGTGNDEIYTGVDQLGTGAYGDIDIVHSHLEEMHDPPTDPVNHADTVYGSAGKDIITASVGDDVIFGFDGADEIDAGEGDNTVDAGAGNDTITANSGNDTITAGLGSDVIEAGWGADLIYTGADEFGTGDPADVDTVDADPQTLTPFPGTELDHGDVVFGSVGADTVFAGLGNNTVTTFAKNDIVTSEGGDDVISTGDGDDVVDAGDGDNTVDLGPGNDEVDTGAGSDTITAGSGSDTVRAGWGADLIHAGVDEFGGGHPTDVDAIDADPKTLNPFPGTLLDHSDVVYGSVGQDLVFAGHGDNIVTTFAGNDEVTAEAGNDTISTGADNDTVHAGTGNNSVDAGSDDDTVDTLDGDDTITGGAGSDIIRAGWGADTIYSGEGLSGGGLSTDNDLIHADDLTLTPVPPHALGHADFIVGSDGNDTVYAGPGDDLISTLDGHDFIEGFSGADNVDAGGGQDIVFGHTQDRDGDDGAKDTIVGGDGDDQIWGGYGDDSLGGGAGNDRIVGEWGNDVIDGGDNDDLILAGRGNDDVEGGGGNDRIEAGYGNDTVSGGGGSDVVLGEQGDDSLRGGSGNDDLRGGPGLDWIDGEGDDDIIDAGAGVGQHLFGGDGNDTITGSSDGATTDPDFFDTNFFGDVIDAGPGNDTVYGLGGADLIRGGVGDDHIESGTGSDHVIAGGGNDWVFVGFDLGEVVYAGEGDDTVIGSDSGDDELFGEGGQDDLFGQGGNDTLRGGLGADVLDGGAGTDRIEGEDGDDELRGGGGPDDQLLGGDGNDLIRGSDDARDFIQGGPGRDTAMGGGGNDVLRGEDGDDVLRGGPGDDLVIGGLGSDVLTGDADHDLLYGHNEPAVFNPADDNADDYLYGDFATNQNEPGSGRDQLDGGGGNDLLFGEGDDDLIVHGAGDLVDYGSGESATESDFVAPVATADPTIASVDPLIRPGLTLPTGLTDTGRWSAFSGSASGDGVSNAPTGGMEPSVAVDADGTRYVAWVDGRSGNQEVYVAKHTDAGGWESLARSAEDGGVSKTPGESRRPSLAIDAGGRPVVAWTEVDGANADIHVARFDSGVWANVGTTANVTATAAADEAVLRNSPDGLVLAWIDRSSGVANGYMRRFDGSTWNQLSGSATGAGVTGSATDIETFRVAVTMGKIAASWTQHVGEQTQIYANQWTISTWDELGGSASGLGVSAAITSAVDSSIAFWNDQLFVSWSENDGPPDLPGSRIGIATFQTGSWSDVTPVGLMPTSMATRQARLASGGGELYLSWTTQPRTPLPHTPIYVARFSGTGFVEDLPKDASGEGIHTGAMVPSELELRVSENGKPYLVWQDQTVGSKTQIFLRGDRSELDLQTRLFVADGSSGKTLGELLAANDLGPGDIILIEGQLGETVTIEADDSGLLIVGDHGALISSVTVNADDVTIQKLSVGTVVASGSRLALRESDVSLVSVAASDAMIFHNDLSNVQINTGAIDTEVQYNAIRSLALNLADGANIQHNRISGGSGLTIQAASSGQIVSNRISGDPAGLTISAPFDGLIAGNDAQGISVGVQYDARAALSGNRISGSPTGVAATVVDLADAFGFVGQTEPNEIFGNTVGVELTGRMQGQLIRDNVTGVTGTGILGADDFTQPNRIEGNTTGVDFDGEIRYNRIGYNEIGVIAKPGQLIAHNLLYRNTDVAIQIDATDDVRVIANTSYAPGGDNLRITGGSKRTELWNNVLWAESGYDIYVDLDSREGFFSDYNVLHSSDTGTLVHWVMDFNDILDFQVDVNEFDLHSIGTTIVNPEWSEPRFINRWRDDYRVYDLIGGQRFTSPTIAAGNPIIDAGRSITGADAGNPLGGHDSVNLLSNASFESGLSDWITNPGSTTRDDHPVGFDFGNYFAGGTVAVGQAVQAVDLAASGISLADIDAGDLRVHFGGRLRSADEAIPDQGRIELGLLDGSGVVLTTLEAISSDTSDRWELVGGVSAIPGGTRSVRFTFTATRNTGNGNDAWMDAAFVRVVHLAYAVDAGPELISPAEQPLDERPQVAIRFPDLYTDWERDKPKVIRWDSYNNQTDIPVKIDLYQESPDGPTFVTTIVAATPDDGQYTWTPANSAVDYGTHDLLIHVSRSDNPLIFDRSAETFAVPENTTTFYVNDDNLADDQCVTAVGDTRHSGRTPDQPKRLPVNLLRVYSLGPNDTLFIDDGTYAQFEPIRLSGTIGIGDDEGFILTGPSLAGASADLVHLVPGTDAALITLDDADFMTIRQLTITNARHGIHAKNGSTDEVFENLTVSGHSSDGIRMEDGSTFSIADQITANNNGGHGIYTTAPANRVSHIVANNNALTGITIGGGILSVEDIQANFNGGDGLASTGAIPSVTRIETTDNGGDGLQLSLVTGAITEVQSLRNQGSGLLASVQTGSIVSGNTLSGNAGSGIDLTGNNGLIKDNTVQNNDGHGIRTSTSTIQSNWVVGNGRTGIRAGNGSVVGDADLSLALGNIVRDNGINGISSSGLIAGNAVSGHTNGTGIYAGNGTAKNNVVFDNKTGITTYDRGGGTVEGNRIYKNADFGVQVYGDALVAGNTLYDNLHGIGIEYEYFSAPDSAQVLNNLIYKHDGWAIRTSTTGDVFENNTIYQPAGDGISITGAPSTTLRNNILSIDQGTGIEVASNSLTGIASDFNLFQIGATASAGTWNGFAKSSLADWQIASLGDQNSIAGDPLFVDPDGADNQLGFISEAADGRDDDFHLLSTVGRLTGSTAPALDAGTGLPVWLAVAEVMDSQQSPAIDRGDVAILPTFEPAPNGGYVNLGAYGDTSHASKSPADFLFVSTPNGSEVWPAGRTFNLSWRASDVGAGSPSMVNIDLIRDSVTDVTPLLTAGVNIGSYQWTIPVSIVPADDYRIRITRVLGGDEIVDESDAPFSIIAPISFYYVNDTLDFEDQYAQAAGNDGNDGLSPQSPKASIQSVLQSHTLSPGDTILVDHGTYVLATDITLGQDLTGVTIAGPTANGTSAVLNRSGGNSVFVFDGADDVTVRNLGITNATYGISTTTSGDSDRIQIRDNDIDANLRNGIYLNQNAADQWLIRITMCAQPSAVRVPRLMEPGFMFSEARPKSVKTMCSATVLSGSS
ncbi:MAG: hypothetical protein F9B45_02590 [Phycisphaera sp. RhM]|nr:hypothetical protein [Phycisphaera sp. RhM]